MTPFTTTTISLGRIATITLIALSTFSSTGCRFNRCGSIYNDCIESCLSSHRAKARATQAWDCSQYCNMGHDVRSGFIDGYVDVALGKRGCTPAVAPSRYWGWRYPDALGQQAGTQWLQGYPLGAGAAKGDGLSYQVATSNVTPQNNVQVPAQQVQYEPATPSSPMHGADTIDGTIEFEPRDVPVDLNEPSLEDLDESASVGELDESFVKRVNEQLDELDVQYKGSDSKTDILTNKVAFEVPPVDTTELMLEQNENEFESWLK